MDKPALYRIVVRGTMAEGWLDRLGDMQVTERGPVATVIEGLIRDQSDLAGVLDTICSLRLPVLEVRRVKELETAATEVGRAAPVVDDGTTGRDGKETLT